MITAARQRVADAVSTVAGYAIRPRPFTASPSPGDGWVEVARVRPLTGYGRTGVLDLVVLVFLGADRAGAEERLEADGMALIAAVADLAALDVSLSPEAVTLAQATAYAARLSLTLEV